jgi:nitric oxide reductase NorD protein
MVKFPEPEETVGHLWHRLVGDAVSYPFHADAAVSLEDVRSLGVFFRGLGGPPGLEIAAGTPRSLAHRLRLRQRLGLESERMETAERSSERLLLPARIGLFHDRELNRGLYLWLAAFLATADETGEPRPGDPLQADLLALRRAAHTTRCVCAVWPGLRETHESLGTALRAARPRRRLPAAERAVEALVMELIGGRPGDGSAASLREAVLGNAPLSAFAAPRGYRPFLPVPLWGEVTGSRSAGGSPPAEEESGGPAEEARDGRRKRASRSRYDQAERDDPFILINKGELMLTWAEMVNVNRAIDDEDPEAAKTAAEDMEEITLGQQRRAAATRLRMDLDLAPSAAASDVVLAASAVHYPEWDWRRRAYRENYCAVFAQPAAEGGELWRPDAAARQRIRRVRRQFEALRPRREIVRRQADGTELDLDAVVRARSDLVAGGAVSDRIYQSTRAEARDLAVSILVDVSLSTDSWADDCRVLDVEKEALTALAFGLEACGDVFAVRAFTSRKRGHVRVDGVKDFEAPLDSRAVCRIAALRPGLYTRMGAALRHVARELGDQPQRNRLLLLLTDGKPNDLDHYEGRYAVEDTRQAVQEARRAGLAVFGVTVDRRARDYFPYIFGRGGYAMIGRIEKLAQALPVIYRHLVS